MPFNNIVHSLSVSRLNWIASVNTSALSTSTMAPIIAPSVRFSNGQQFPVFGLGTWQAPAGEVGQAVKDAIDIGYRHIDCAMLYGNEKEIGEAIREKIKEGVVKREHLFITSKLWNTFHRPEIVVPTCKQTLADLGVDYVDLYLIHWPVAFKEGNERFPKVSDDKFDTRFVDIAETYLAMEKCVKQGLAKSIGVSNFNSKQVERVLEVATIKPVCNQIECHPYLNQKKLTKFCADRGITVCAYCPLGGQVGPLKTNLLTDEKLVSIAKKYGKSSAQIALKYLIQIGTVPIPKSVKKERLRENIDIFDFEISPEDIAIIDKLDCNGRTIPFLWGKHDQNYPFAIEF